MSSNEGSFPDLGGLLSHLGQMQESLKEAQQAAAEQVVEGTAGGGAVRVQVTGGLEFKSVSIDAAVVDPEDVEMLEDLVLAAVRDAIDKAHGLTTQAIGELGNLSGLGDLGGLSNLGTPGPGAVSDQEGGSVDPGGILGL